MKKLIFAVATACAIFAVGAQVISERPPKHLPALAIPDVRLERPESSGPSIFRAQEQTGEDASYTDWALYMKADVKLTIQYPDGRPGEQLEFPDMDIMTRKFSDETVGFPDEIKFPSLFSGKDVRCLYYPDSYQMQIVSFANYFENGSYLNGNPVTVYPRSDFRISATYFNDNDRPECYLSIAVESKTPRDGRFSAVFERENPAARSATLKIASQGADVAKIYYVVGELNSPEYQSYSVSQIAAGTMGELRKEFVPTDASAEFETEVPFSYPGTVRVQLVAVDKDGVVVSSSAASTYSNVTDAALGEWKPFVTGSIHDVSSIAQLTAALTSMCDTKVGLDWADLDSDPSWEVGIEVNATNPSLLRIQNPYGGNCPFTDGYGIMPDGTKRHFVFDRDNDYCLIADLSARRIYTTENGVKYFAEGSEPQYCRVFPAYNNFSYTGTSVKLGDDILFEWPLGNTDFFIDMENLRNGINILGIGDGIDHVEYMISLTGESDWDNPDDSDLRGSVSATGPVDFSAYGLKPFEIHRCLLRGVDALGNVVNEGYNVLMTFPGVELVKMGKVRITDNSLSNFGVNGQEVEADYYMSADDMNLIYIANPDSRRVGTDDLRGELPNYLVFNVSDPERVTYDTYATEEYWGEGWGYLTLVDVVKYLESLGNDAESIYNNGYYGTYRDGNIVFNNTGVRFSEYNPESVYNGGNLTVKMPWAKDYAVEVEGFYPTYNLYRGADITELKYTLVTQAYWNESSDEILNAFRTRTFSPNMTVYTTERRRFEVDASVFSPEESQDYVLVVMGYRDDEDAARNPYCIQEVYSPIDMVYKCEGVYGDMMHLFLGEGFWAGYQPERTVEVMAHAKDPNRLFVMNPYAEFPYAVEATRFVEINISDPQKISVPQRRIGFAPNNNPEMEIVATADLSDMSDGDFSDLYGSFNPSTGKITFPAKGLVLLYKGDYYYANPDTEHTLLTLPAVTGIDAPEIVGESDADASAEFFDIMGRRVERPASGGVYIRRQGPSVTKIFVK